MIKPSHGKKTSPRYRHLFYRHLFYNREQARYLTYYLKNEASPQNVLVSFVTVIPSLHMPKSASRQWPSASRRILSNFKSLQNIVTVHRIFIKSCCWIRNIHQLKVHFINKHDFWRFVYYISKTIMKVKNYVFWNYYFCEFHVGNFSRAITERCCGNKHYFLLFYEFNNLKAFLS